MVRALPCTLGVLAPLLSAQAPDLAIDGPEPGAELGASVDGAGDVDGDGRSDLVAGAPLDQSAGTSAFAGSIRAYRGTDGAPLLVVYGSPALPQLGAEVVGAGDADGDGLADVAGSYAGTADGRVRVFSSAGGAVLADYPGAGFEQLGADLCGAGDVDGDGVPDLVAGAPGHDATPGGNQGRALVLSGAGGAPILSFAGAQPGAAAGRGVAGAGDIDGDGTADILVGAPLHDGVGVNSGRVTAVSGATGAALFVLGGGAAGDRFGDAVSGGADVNGDGIPDLVIGAHGSDLLAPEGGAMVAYSGASGAALFSAAGAELGEMLGAAVTSGGDRNGDGRADPAAGAQGSEFGKGRTQTFSGKQGFALLHTTGAATGDFHGAALADAGDTDGDGLADLLVGTFGHDGERGRIELYRGAAGDLLGSPQAISIATGGFQDLYLDPGAAHAGEIYWVLGSTSGTAPGFDAFGLHVPLEIDGYFLYALGCPTCPPFAGNLQPVGADGTARTRLIVPGGVLGPGQIGAQFHHAYVLLRDGVPDYVSSPVPLGLVP